MTDKDIAVPESRKYRVVLTYCNKSVRIVEDSISLGAALMLHDSFCSIDEDEIESLTIERAIGKGSND